MPSAIEKWQCDYCYEEFESCFDCEEHEEECSHNPKNFAPRVFPENWNRVVHVQDLQKIGYACQNDKRERVVWTKCDPSNPKCVDSFEKDEILPFYWEVYLTDNSGKKINRIVLSDEEFNERYVFEKNIPKNIAKKSKIATIPDCKDFLKENIVT